MKTRVLLVEDDDAKAKDVTELIARCVPGPELLLHRATSFVEALTHLQQEKYSIAILDLTIPLRSDSRHATSEAGVMLLREIAEGSVNRPAYVLGLTGFSENIEQYEAEFADQLWCLIRYEAGHSQWRSQLSRLIDHSREQENLLSSASDETVDVAVVCALKNPEFAHVLKLPWDWHPDWFPIGREHFYRRAQVRKAGRNLRVAATAIRRMGMVPASQLATLMIDRLRPQVLIMTGICGGYVDRARLGDLLIADRSWDWQSGKYVEQKGSAGFLIDPDFIPATPSVVAAAERISDITLRTIHDNWQGNKPPTTPKLVVGPMASGSAVLTDANKSAEISIQQRKVAGLDMETYGVYFAAEHAPRTHVNFLSMKAVSDHADGDKSDSYQEWCSHLSAQTLNLLLDDPAIYE